MRTPKITAYTRDRRWIVEPCPPQRAWFDTIADAWKSCLPLFVASQFGWVVRCPYAFEICWMGQRDTGSLAVTSEEDMNHSVASHFGSGVLTISMPLAFTTSSPYGLLVTGPLNNPKEGIHPLSGYVETFWSPYPFTMNWKVTAVGERIRFNAGEPICLIIPYDISMLQEAQVEMKDMAEAPPELLERGKVWHAQRAESVQKMHTGDMRDRLYLQGRCPIDHSKMVASNDHVMKLDLPRF